LFEEMSPCRRMVLIAAGLIVFAVVLAIVLFSGAR
jgi:hypothetical protein